ncbi:hypothetical protein B0H10DRAFT_1805566, partial [Mycena sp. CBHHK59/15]
GIDAVSYSKIMTIPNKVLVQLYNTCVKTINSYYLVGLECCLLKVLTLLFDERLREWTDANDMVPDSQTGFHPGHCTNDNIFILLCAVHWARAEQAKVTKFFFWCSNKRVFISANKSKWMIFGPLPSVLLILHLGDLTVTLVHEFKYVGMWFSSMHVHIFTHCYMIKASKIRSIAHAIFALKNHIGSIPVHEGIQLYVACVDCYLMSGYEVSLNINGSLLQEHLDT